MQPPGQSPPGPGGLGDGDAWVGSWPPILTAGAARWGVLSEVTLLMRGCGRFEVPACVAGVAGAAAHTVYITMRRVLLPSTSPAWRTLKAPLEHHPHRLMIMHRIEPPIPAEGRT